MAAAGGAFEEVLDAARVAGGGGGHGDGCLAKRRGGEEAKVIGSGVGAVVSGAVVAEAGRRSVAVWAGSCRGRAHGRNTGLLG